MVGTQGVWSKGELPGECAGDTQGVWPAVATNALLEDVGCSPEGQHTELLSNSK